MKLESAIPLLMGLALFHWTAAGADDSILSARLMYVPFTPINNESDLYRTRDFRILDQQEKEKGRGQPLSDSAAEVADWPLYGRGTEQKNENFFWFRYFATGAEKQAVAFPAEANWNAAQGALTFWIKGLDWDVNTSQVEELVTLESAEGNATLAKIAPKTLALTGPAGQRLSIPIDFAPDRWHFFAITYDGKSAQIYVDGQPRLTGDGSKSKGGEGAPFKMPGQVSRIVVGQLTAGGPSTGRGTGQTNKAIDEIKTYNRPLLLSEVNRLVIDEGQPFERKLISVAKARKPIQVDGIIDPAEWNGAAEITGLLKVKSAGLYEFIGPCDVAADQSRFWVTYDDQNLYIAHHSPPPAKIAEQVQLVVAMLQSNILKHDDSVDQDDCIRISLMNPYPNGDEYKIYLNAVGTTYDFYRGGNNNGSKLDGINLQWESKVKTRSTLTDKGWSVEAAIPWNAFYFGPPKPGEVRRLNLVRFWRGAIKEEDAWCFGARTGEEDARTILPEGEARFDGDESVVVQLKDIGQIRRGAVDFKASLINQTGASQNLAVKVTTNSGEVNHEEQMTLAAGETKPYEFQGRIVDFRTHAISFTVANAADGKLYHVTTLPVLRKDKPEIRVRKYRSIEKLKLQTNMEFLSRCPPAQIRVGVAIKNRQSDRAVFNKNYSKFATYTPEFEVSTEGWPVGTYEAELTFRASGAKPCRATTPYERTPLPEWWDNRIGAELGVPYPWTAMKVDQQTIDCWGRRYQFGKRLLPEQILTQNRPLLRAPMRLVFRDADGKIFDTAPVDAQSKWTKQGDLRVEGERAVAGPGFTLSNQFWSEYDGLVWCRLTIQPQARLTLNSMELEIPLTKEFTDVINTYDYSLQGTGKLKPEGFTSEMRPIWLGNGDGGLQWFCETDGWFFVKDNTKVMRVDAGPEGATLRVTMIDTPTGFDKPHTIEFGFMATPVRPRAYRTWRDPQFWGFRGGPGPWYPMGEEFLPAPDYWGGRKGGWRAFCDGNVGGVFLAMQNIYVTTGGINTKTDDFRNFGDEWLANDNTEITDLVTTTHASKSYRDWFVWRHWKSFQGNPHQSLYYDGAAESPSSNPYAGAGYVRRDGTIARTYPILGARDICKRLYNMIIDQYPFAWVGFHQSGMPNMAYMGFGTDCWDGENLNGSINEKQPTYIGVLDPAKFRAEYMGHNWGWPVMFLGQGRIRAEWADEAGIENVIDHLHGLCLLHDVQATGWQIAGEREKVCERTFRAVERHRLNHPAYQFVPYWRQDLVQLPSPGMYASFYILQPWKMDPTRDWAFYTPRGDGAIPKKVVMIVYNDTEWKGEMRLKPDWKKLGFDKLDGAIVENAVHRTGFRIEKAKNEKGEEVDRAVFFPRPEEFARLENGELVFPMTKFNYRMIAITQPQ